MIDQLKAKMQEYFVGKEAVVDDVLVCLLAGGHILLEDVPGVGKTTLARTLAGAVSCDFGRIQFTPDTLPGDVVGTSVYNMKTGEFEYHEGAIMHQIILADEINRTSPKTQASLLEAMEEGQVTIDGQVHKLPKPFMVIATQNPVENAGTFPLPEAQLDRFAMKLSMGLPARDEELAIIDKYMKDEPFTELESVVSLDDLDSVRGEANEVYVHKCVREYIVDIVEATRNNSEITMGVSPRGTLALLRCAKAYACLLGRSFCTPDDVKAVATAVLSHTATFAIPSAAILPAFLAAFARPFSLK